VQNGSGQGSAAYQCPPLQICCEQPSVPGLQSSEHSVPDAMTLLWKRQESTGRRVYLCLTRAEAPGTPASTASAAANETIFNAERIRMMNPSSSAKELILQRRKAATRCNCGITGCIVPRERRILGVSIEMYDCQRAARGGVREIVFIAANGD
jgi:hypothetical protein